ncbi:EF-hand domain-containing protein [Nonomuraea zeae]|uniref:EF-hand domain-containing protein n=1 Tax=Nonomuraea zeae TaxID=1642303 RepID=UPI0014797A73|nr:EF-hand domain-containing protein [Nonomuraea zeae]
MSEDHPSRLIRLRIRFSLLDADGDGRLQAEDFDLLAGRILDALAVKRTSAKATALLEACRTYWQGLVAALDGDADDVVTFEEYAAALRDDAHFDQYGQPYVHALASLADWNEDGQVERADFLACMTAIGFGRPQVERIYAELGFDGAVAAEEWEAAIRDFYLSATADTPGQFLARQSA